MIASPSRKERERAAREELIVSHAQELLAREGFQDLNLDELAHSIEYAKGTIYLHFKTKEDLVLAVMTRQLKERADLLERAAGFSGSTRERARALSCASCQFVSTHQDHFALELMLKLRSFSNRVSEEQRQRYLKESRRVFEIPDAIVREAIAAGDLPARTRADDVTLSLIAITIGSHCAVTQPEWQSLCRARCPIRALQLHQNLVLDGWGWKPLSAELDFKALDRRIGKEIFPEADWLKR